VCVVLCVCVCVCVWCVCVRGELHIVYIVHDMVDYIPLNLVDYGLVFTQHNCIVTASSCELRQ